jgi:hypothetical protein
MEADHGKRQAVRQGHPVHEGASKLLEERGRRTGYTLDDQCTYSLTALRKLARYGIYYRWCYSQCILLWSLKSVYINIEAIRLNSGRRAMLQKLSLESNA